MEHPQNDYGHIWRDSFAAALGSLPSENRILTHNSPLHYRSETGAEGCFLFICSFPEVQGHQTKCSFDAGTRISLCIGSVDARYIHRCSRITVSMGSQFCGITTVYPPSTAVSSRGQPLYSAASNRVPSAGTPRCRTPSPGRFRTCR